METVQQNLRYNIRMLAKRPAFTAVALITLVGYRRKHRDFQPGRSFLQL